MAIFRKLIFRRTHGSQNLCRNPQGRERMDPEVTGMINNEELPIGFTMELAQHSDVLNHFSHLSKQEQESVIEGARSIKSHNEMRNYVESLFK